jgi:hypothetical protein
MALGSGERGWPQTTKQKMSRECLSFEYMLQLRPVGISTTLPTHQRPSGHIWQDMKDIKDISEKELTKLYAEYQAALGRPVPAVVHRQGRSIPGCVSAETSAAWRFANKPLEAK